MPRGGRRANSGRKQGGANIKTREFIDSAAVRGCKLPLEYMLNVMGDETASLARRDAMAVASAAYCHPKLTAVSVSNHGGREGGGDVSITQIFAIPRGALIDRSGKVTTLEGTAVEIQPFEPTPALVTDQSQPAPLEPIAEPLPVQLIDVSNVTILRRRDDDDPSSGGA